ncbi:MAG: hypothetical protein II620_05145, partial [Paludibacteraceae bacterium]|nr:hypothetical protein [Paludibacteraceae bacterium]
QNKYWKKLSFFSWLQETGMDVLGLMFVLPAYLGYCVLVKHSMSAGDFVASFNGAYQIAAAVNFLTVWALSVFSERDCKDKALFSIRKIFKQKFSNFFQPRLCECRSFRKAGAKVQHFFLPTK